MSRSKFYSTLNRCRRCKRELTDPTALFGWRCAEIINATHNKFNPKSNIPPNNNDKTKYNWDENNISYRESQEIYKYKELWLQAKLNNNTIKMKSLHKQAEEIRKKYRMPYEYTDDSGITKIDAFKYKVFIDKAMEKNGKKVDVVPPYIIAGAIASQLDGPVPGPADAIGILIIIGGFIITETAIYFARGKSNPRDLEKGMSKR